MSGVRDLLIQSIVEKKHVNEELLTSMIQKNHPEIKKVEILERNENNIKLLLTNDEGEVFKSEQEVGIRMVESHIAEVKES